MSDKSNYAVLGKTLAKYGKRLKPFHYKDLLALNSVAEVVDYLRSRTAYSDVLSKIRSSDIHRAEIEQILRKRRFEEIAELCRYEIFGDEGFLEYIIMQNEIEQILICIQLLNSGNLEEYLFYLPSFFDKHTKINLFALAKAKNYSDLLQSLSCTRYYEILKKFKADKHQKLDILAVEAALDTCLYRYAFSHIERQADVKEELSDLIGTQAELSNIVKIYRLKKFFASSPEYIRSLLIPFRADLNKKQMDLLIDAKEAGDIYEILNSSPYSKYLKQFGDMEIDELAHRIMYHKAKQHIRFTSSPLVVLASYIVLTKIELSNIINIIEAIRYRLPKENISKMLILS